MQVTDQHPVLVPSGPTGVKIINRGNATVYYAQSPAVSSTSSDGSLIPNLFVTLPGPVYVRTAPGTVSEVDALTPEVSRIRVSPVSTAPRLSRMTPLTLFQAGYTVTSGTGALTLLDTTVPGYQQAGALKVVSPTDNSVTKVRNSSVFAPAIDLTGKQLAALIYVDDVVNIADFKLFLSSDSFTNFGTIELMGSGSTFRPVRSGEWQLVTFSWGDFNLTGAPVRSAITNLQLQCTGANGKAVTFLWGGLWSLNEPASGVVSICFDDGWLTQYTNARKTMDQYGLPATGYAIADLIEAQNPAYMSLTQMQELRDFHQWEWCCHAYTVANHNAGFDTLSDDALAGELLGIRSWLSRNGFVSGIDHFALPLGAYNISQLPFYRTYFRSVRTIGSLAFSASETFPPFNPLRLRAQSVNQSTSTATVAGWVTKAIANKEWLILLFHDVQPGTPAGSIQIGQANFDTIISNIAGQVGATLACRTVPDQMRQAAP